MDCLTQQIQVYAKINRTVLEAQISLENILYECFYSPPENINLALILAALQAKEIEIKRQGKQLNVSISKGLITLAFQHCCSKHWFQISTFNQIPAIFKAYPLTHYELGVRNNNWMMPMPVNLCQWNVGFRVITKDLIPRGDNAKSMMPARIMWTKGTSDPESKGENWYHQYVDENFKPFHSNGQQNPKLYARKL